MGKVIGINTLGGIVGTLLTGFALVPALGLERSLSIMAVAAGLVGTIAVLHSRSAFFRIATLSCPVVSIMTAILISPDRLAKLLASARGELLFHQDGVGGTVSVIEQRHGKHTFRRLYIQGVSNSGDSLLVLGHAGRVYPHSAFADGPAD